MVKVRDYQMKTGDPEFSLSGISFDGFKVETLTPGSIAEKAGLMPGDEIAEINGRPADEKALEQIEERLAAGRSVAIIYERGEKKSVATLKWPR
jgi:C-terminal processing protease CtpA/Prc